ncbi:helix-turn-helix domain-containing protein [Liquorilactobacillus satsumensis]|uniref:Cro CI family transcriptional regulator n=1 Tax=Liquorilactobacillus satsumensis DSM 16230 = JCM 12392 TaxID=1423801 RepID=A0A0R1UWZ3_9LACO|nr:helix-turn-helix transcriptional regulator [Liquorilactobacillus satsumensis]KRL97761.1 Cro CI family transcriptional regulator [Liquorilactobacillus satsumensis DSM 16230 = JCM 12392]MCC7666177.1 XRE family transcriptional regulator [Liquorilactobacillus satsumensis]MCP9313396.1 helix-turn-helix transcriptional regulator [Liquorilactobacillus satsumensis]MCP9329142.1 helix-turn-helix transcriptional regulator [Liquorilactobacillus satsumensis]MCP9357444.1 helix-turn-helix transcriptional r
MFPEQLKALRTGRGLTLAELAAKLNTMDDKISQRPNTGPQIGSWERGINTPSYLDVYRLARFFGVSLDFMVGRNSQVLDLSDVFALNNQLVLEGHLLSGKERAAIYGLIKGYLQGKYPQKQPAAAADTDEDVTLPLN